MCAQCRKSFAKQQYLKDHINSVHIKSVVCDFCGFSVAKKRTGFPQALEIMENLENHKKSSMHGKIMESEKLK